MKWKVEGADRVTGVDRVIFVEAVDAITASAAANAAGIVVAAVVPAPVEGVGMNNAQWIGSGVSIAGTCLAMLSVRGEFGAGIAFGIIILLVGLLIFAAGRMTEK